MSERSVDSAEDLVSPVTLTGSQNRLELAGNRTLLLDDPAASWAVTAGIAYVFAVPVEGGVSVGGREYVCQVDAGSALFGMSVGDARVALLAVGRPGTLLERLDQDDERLIAGWVHALSSAIGDPAPRDVVEVPADRPTDTVDGAAYQPRVDLLWATVTAGTMQLQGVGDALIDATSGPLPLSSATWLRSVGTGRIAPERAPESLGAFHRVVLAALASQLESRSEARAARSRARLAADDAILDDGLSDLLSFFEDGAIPVDHVGARVASADPLLAACRLVGGALGVDVEAPPAWQAGGRDSLAAIARASHLRLRQVTLDGEWWRSASGPILGFDAGSRQPVALLPKSARSYQVVDPATGSRKRVTAEVAASLSVIAYSLYRPFPQRSLGVVDLLRFGLRKGGSDLWMIIVMGVLGGLLALVVPIATGLLFNRFIPASDGGGVVQVAIAMLLSVGAITAFQLTRSIAVARLGARMDLSLEAAVWDRLLGLPVPFFRDYSSGDLALRATSISAMRRALSGVVTTAVLGAAFSVFSYALLFVYDVRLALVATVLLAGALLLGLVMLVVQVRDRRKANAVRGHQIGLVFEMLNGISKLRVAGAEARAFSVWARFVPGASGRRADLAAVQVNVVYAALPLVALLVIFPLAVSGTDLTAGTFLAFNAALTQVITAVVLLGTSLSAVAQIVPLYERVKPILVTLPEVDDARSDPGELSGDIEFSEVTFRYATDAPIVLERISFRARPGEFVALVGSSGSGKSTMLRLLLGFESPESGSIHLDAQDLAALDLQAVRRQMGVVLQAGKLASGSIYQNIVGSSPYTLDDAWEAAQLRARRRHPPDADGHAHDGDGGWQRNLGRATAAVADREGDHRQAADPAVRRGDQRARQPNASRGHGQPGAPQGDPSRHRAPIEHRHPRRPDPRGRGRTRCRTRNV